MSIHRHLGSLATGALLAVAAHAAEGPVERWEKAVGGLAQVAPIRAIYREATIQVGPYEGWIKAWHTADGKYRKEEQVGLDPPIDASLFAVEPKPATPAP